MKLNLLTLEFERIEVRSRAHSFADTPASVLAGGILLGGVQMTPFGVRTVPKLDFVLLAGLLDSDSNEDEAQHEAATEGEDEDDDEDGMSLVVVRLQEQNGRVRIMRMPRRLVAHMIQAEMFHRVVQPPSTRQQPEQGERGGAGDGEAPAEQPDETPEQAPADPQTPAVADAQADPPGEASTTRATTVTTRRVFRRGGNGEGCRLS